VLTSLVVDPRSRRSGRPLSLAQRAMTTRLRSLLGEAMNEGGSVVAWRVRRSPRRMSVARGQLVIPVGKERDGPGQFVVWVPSTQRC